MPRLWTSPRLTSWVDADRETVLRFESTGDWLAVVQKRMRRIGMLDADVALAMLGDAIETGAPQDPAALVVRFASSRKRASRTMELARACALVARVADLVRAHAALEPEADRDGPLDVLGPFDPALVVETDEGDRLVAPGLVYLAQLHDRGIRGMRGGHVLAHYRSTYDEIRGKPALPHEVTSLAVLLIELVSGREPYPTDNDFAYLTAVTQGAHVPIAPLVPTASRALVRALEAALVIDAAARPSLQAFREVLRAEPGVETLARAGVPAAARPWWKVW